MQLCIHRITLNFGNRKALGYDYCLFGNRLNRKCSIGSPLQGNPISCLPITSENFEEIGPTDRSYQQQRPKIHDEELKERGPRTQMISNGWSLIY